MVVGGRGFIGSHVAQRASSLGWRVVTLGLSKPKLECPNHIVCDLRDRSELKSALAGTKFDYVVNCGGYVDHRLISTGGDEVFEAHFSGLLNLVASLDRLTLKAFIQIGSSDEYGAGTAAHVEEQREVPISPYSAAKTAGSHFLQMLWRTEDFPAITLRLFLTYGQGQDDRRFIPQIIRGCLGGHRFPTSQGEQVRDFCYIDDTVDAIFAALSAKQALGEVINVASGRPVRIRQVIEMIRDLVGRGDPEFGVVPYRTGESMALVASIEKSRKLLDWSPGTDLRTGLQKTIAFYREPA